MQTQEPPKWVWDESLPKQRAKRPTPRAMPKKKPGVKTAEQVEVEVLVAQAKAMGLTGVPVDVMKMIVQALAEGQSQKVAALSAPYIARHPQARPPKAKEIPRLHVRIELSGSIELTFEGDESVELREMLNNGATADEIIEHLDPWSSDAEIRQHVTILQDPGPELPSNEYFGCYVNEANGTVVQGRHHVSSSPYYYTLSSGNPYLVSWDRSPYPVTVPWEPKK